MDAATIFVLLLAAAYFGFFLWVEIHSRRNRNKIDGHNQPRTADRVEQTPESEAPRAEIATKTRR
jgi:hypothetical protein